MTRRMVTGGAAAAVAVAGLWGYFASRDNPEFDQLVTRADQILRYAVPQTTVQAVALLRRAVRIEPRDAGAWGLLAYALATSGDDDEPRPDAMAATENAIRMAHSLDPREPNGLLARFTFTNSLREWTETDRNFRTILQLDPDNTFAMRRLLALLQAAGMNRESWNWNERAIAIDPLAPIHQYRKALKYWIFGQIQKADATADTLMLRWPAHPWVWNARFLIYALTGRANAALDMLNDDQARPKSITPPAVTTWRLSLAALDTRSPQAIAAAREASLKSARIGPGLAAYGAMIMSELGEVDAAYQIMDGFLLGRGSVITRQRRAPGQFVHTAGWRTTQWMFTPATAAVRADPRFGPLCDGIGLTDYWQSRKTKPDYLTKAG